jgi:hypothetical protein
VDSLLHSVPVSEICDKLLVLDLLQILFLHDLLLCYPDYFRAMYYTKVLDFIASAHYCIVFVLHTATHCYTLVLLQTASHYYTMVVLEIVAWYYIVVVVHYYNVVVVQVVFSLNILSPYMHLMSPTSLSPRLCSHCLHVQLT